MLVEVSRIKNYSDLNVYLSTIQDIAHLFATAKMINLKASVRAYLRPPPLKKYRTRNFFYFVYEHVCTAHT